MLAVEQCRLMAIAWLMWVHGCRAAQPIGFPTLCVNMSDSFDLSDLIHVCDVASRERTGSLGGGVQAHGLAQHMHHVPCLLLLPGSAP